MPEPARGSTIPLLETLAGLSPDEPYHWQLRVRTDSPLAPHAPWFCPPRTTDSESHLRTSPEDPSGADAPVSRASGLLLQVGPNPILVDTEIRYHLARRSAVDLGILDASGRHVAGLVDAVQDPGWHRVRWSGANDRGGRLPRGLYWIRLRAGDLLASEKLMLAR
jgi:hypothetical protein